MVVFGSEMTSADATALVVKMYCKMILTLDDSKVWQHLERITYGDPTLKRVVHKLKTASPLFC